MSRSSTGGCWAEPSDHVVQLRRDPLLKLLEGCEDLEGRLAGRGPVADVPDPHVAAPAGRLALRVDHRVGSAALGVENELARSAAVDPEGLEAAGRRVGPLAEEDADESNLAALAGADTNDDLVEPLPSALLDVDIPAEGGRDRGREIVAGQLLGTLIQGEVSIGDVDRLVRHLSIVTPIQRTSYT